MGIKHRRLEIADRQLHPLAAAIAAAAMGFTFTDTIRRVMSLVARLPVPAARLYSLAIRAYGQTIQADGRSPASAVT